MFTSQHAASPAPSLALLSQSRALLSLAATFSRGFTVCLLSDVSGKPKPAAIATIFCPRPLRSAWIVVSLRSLLTPSRAVALFLAGQSAQRGRARNQWQTWKVIRSC